MNSLLGTFFDEALDEFVILPLEESILQFFFALITEDDLRTLDSLQLPAALSLDTAAEKPVFVCADSELATVAEDNGLETVTPQEEGE